MWRESLRIGIDVIDEQHKALFDKIEELRIAVQDSGADRKQQCIDAIVFLKDYTIKHFADEEAYQQSIGYKRFEAHKKLHQGFIKTLSEHEKKLKRSKYSEGDVKAFTGMLVAWLLYHVADADQKIGKETPAAEQHGDNYEMVVYSIGDVLSKMAGYDADAMRGVDSYTGAMTDMFSVEVSLTGAAEGYIIYSYPLAFIKELMNVMLGYEPASVGELEMSALFELANIISGTISRQIAHSHGNALCDISTPFIAQKTGHNPGERFAVDTGHGVIETEVAIKYN